MIDHQTKTVFIHVPKCGGTSIESSFNVSARSRDDERATGWSGKRKMFLQHATARQIRKWYPETNDYTFFTFVRNPYDKLVSTYHYFKRLNILRVSSFKEFVCTEKPVRKYNINKPHFISQHEYTHSKSGEQLVQHIGRFEQLQQDFDNMCKYLNITVQMLPHENKSKHHVYTKYYDDETRAIVSERFAKDLELFKYTF